VSAAFPQLEVIELIGAGGMGAVFRARQPKLNRLVALKVLPASLAERDPAFAERFEREGQMLARLHHPNIVAVYDSGRAGDFFYLLMEHVDGVNLRQAMRASRFTPAQALGIVPRICDALQYAHDEGVLHRDIKPENILLDAKGRVKLADFGIAKLIGDGTPDSPRAIHASHPANLTQAGAALGTPSYMAPEQRETPSDVDHRADIYSLGVVFYELLTGELPHGAFARPSAKSDADPRVDAIVQQALEKERARRQSSASEVKTQVETLANTPLQPSPPANAAAGSRILRKTIRRVALIGAALLLVLGSALFLADRLLPPIYFAKVTMEVRRLGGEDSERNWGRFLKGETLDAVIEGLRLREKWASREQSLTNERARSRLLGAIEIRHVRNTGLVEIGAYATDPNQAAQIANVIAVAYQKERIADWEKWRPRELANLEEEIRNKPKEIEAAASEAAKIRAEAEIDDPKPESMDAIVRLSKQAPDTAPTPDEVKILKSYQAAKSRYVQSRRIYEAAQMSMTVERMKRGRASDAVKIWEKAEPPWKPIPLSLRRLRHAFSR
jgi:serine/threonine protein kinase